MLAEGQKYTDISANPQYKHIQIREIIVSTIAVLTVCPLGPPRVEQRQIPRRRFYHPMRTCHHVLPF